MNKLKNKVLLGLLFGVLLMGCKEGNGGSGFVPETAIRKPTPPTVIKDGPFAHPGVLNSAAALDLIAQQVDRNDPTRTAAYKKVTDFIASKSYPNSFYAIVAVGSNGHTSPSKSQIRSDSELAYAYALKFAKTADLADANKCIGILNGWASTFKKYEIIDATDNVNQPALETSWTTPTFVAAAEIIRYYKPKGVSANWSATDIKQFSDYLSLVKTYIDKIPNYKNNWNVSAGYALMTIGIFQNNTSVYANGIATLKTVMPLVIGTDGTMPELCDRQDCVHYQYSLTGLTYAAEIASMQEDNSLYSALQNRISAGYDFTRKAYNRTTSCVVCSASSPMFPGIEVALKHYGTGNMQSLRDQQAPFGIPNDNTFLGFTSYTHFKI